MTGGGGWCDPLELTSEPAAGTGSALTGITIGTAPGIPGTGVCRTGGCDGRPAGRACTPGSGICDAEGRNIYCSESFLNLVGMTQQECTDIGWTDVLHPDWAAASM